MPWLNHEEVEILLTIRQLRQDLTELKREVKELREEGRECCEKQTGLLEQILAKVTDLDTPPPAVRFTAAVTIP